MRIHSDVIIEQTIRDALSSTGLRDRGVWLDSAMTHRSRRRARGIEFRLAADPLPGRRRRNTGQYGAEDSGLECLQAAATYDEHGELFAALFELDPAAIIGPYAGRDEFHRKTADKYRPVAA